MKNLLKTIILLLLIISLSACISNKIDTALSGADKNGIPNKAKSGGNNMMLPLLGESDTKLMEDFFPTALKLYEILHTQNPKHQGLSAMTGSLYVMYANAFVQTNADMMPLEMLEEQQAEINRAKLHYLRGRDYCFEAFEGRYPGFTENIKSNDEEKINKATSMLKKTDVSNAYWAGAGWLGAFGVDPLNVDILYGIRGAVSLLEKACQLDPGYNKGAIWEVLTAFYAAAPADFGGDDERAKFCYEKALECSGGNSISQHILYAQSFCIPNQDVKGFDEAIEKALAINPDEDPATRLATTVSKRKAEFLKSRRDELFIIWE